MWILGYMIVSLSSWQGQYFSFFIVRWRVEIKYGNSDLESYVDAYDTHTIGKSPKMSDIMKTVLVVFLRKGIFDVEEALNQSAMSGNGVFLY